MLEQIALWWCYGFGIMAAILVYAFMFLWMCDKLAEVFKVKRAILDWAWYRAKGYTLVDPETNKR